MMQGRTAPSKHGGSSAARPFTRPAEEPARPALHFTFFTSAPRLPASRTFPSSPTSSQDSCLAVLVVFLAQWQSLNSAASGRSLTLLALVGSSSRLRPRGLRARRSSLPFLAAYEARAKTARAGLSARLSPSLPVDHSARLKPARISCPSAWLFSNLPRAVCLRRSPRARDLAASPSNGPCS